MSLRKILAGACALSATLVIAAPAQARVINVSEEFESTTNDCVTGEEIAYTQKFHAVVRTAIVDGEEQVVDILRYDLSNGSSTGVGVVSGDEYVINQNVTTRDQTNPLTLNAQFQVINKGSGADFMVTEVFHTTTNANGEVTVFKTSANIRCGDFHDHVNAKL